MGLDDRTYRDRRELALTDPQERFARGIAAGLSPTEAARIAGYSAPGVAGSRLNRAPAVRERVRLLRNNEIDKLASLSLKVLRELLTRKGDPARGVFPVSDAVKLNAVKLSLALAGHTEKPSEEANALKSKDIEAMSVDELDAFIASERNKRADASKPVIDHEQVQPEANPLKDKGKTEPFEGSALLIEGSCEPVDPPSGEGEP